MRCTKATGLSNVASPRHLSGKALNFYAPCFLLFAGAVRMKVGGNEGDSGL